MSETASTLPVLITGSSGFIGRQLANMMSTEFPVIALDLKEPSAPIENVTFFQTDLTKDASVVSTMQAVRERFGNRLASVVHLAAYYDFSGKPSRLYSDVTIDGTERVLQSLKEFQVEQFIFSSSLLVMKPAAEATDVITEQSPTQPAWLYPQSKLEAELVVKTYAPAIPKVILRLAGVYDEWCHSIPIAQQIRRIYERKLESHLFPGDKSHGQPFIHLDDAVACIRAAIAKRGELDKQEVFLVAEPEVLSYEQLQDAIGVHIHGERWATIRIPKSVARAGARMKEVFARGDETPFIKPWMIDLADAHYPVEIRRVTSRLGWSPRHRLDVVLQTMVAHLKRNPKLWYDLNHLKWPGKEPFGEDEDRSLMAG